LAQQLPNNDFEGAWSESVPWTSRDNTQSLDGALTPARWTLSHVMGMSMGERWLGSTIVGEKIPDMEGNSAVRMYNSPNSLASSQIVPGYISLGTTWSTSVMVDKADGGTFGGVEFNYKPDALQFVYRRTHGEANPEENATVIGYLWKGTFFQADVPGEIVIGGTPMLVEMRNRDRNILGMETSQGGAVSKTEDAACIAKMIHKISGNMDNWTKSVMEFQYLDENAQPEMINLIFSAGDYFSTTPGQGNTLDIDDVNLIYYSRLSSITINGVEIPLSEGKYEYDVELSMPAEQSEIVCMTKGVNASADILLDAESSTVRVKVKNIDADIDGLNEHNYTFKFSGNRRDDYQSYIGKLSVEMGGENLCSDQAATVNITFLSDKICKFCLPNLVLGELGSLGDIEMDGVDYLVNQGITTYVGRQDNMSLMDGAIIADFVELHGTTTDAGDAEMHIDVMWNNLPIKVIFTASEGSDIRNIATDEYFSPIEYYTIDGRRVMAPQLEKGIYIHKQGKKTTKILIR
jgi:hypothetical protein